MSLIRTAVHTDGAPAPRPGIYNQGIVVNGLVYTSGVTGKDPATGKMVDGPIENRTVSSHRLLSVQFFPLQAFANPTSKSYSTAVDSQQHRCIESLGSILEAAGSSLENVVEVSLFLTDMDDFDRVNVVYKTYWGKLKPART